MPTYTSQWKYDRSLALSILKEFGFGKRLMEDRIVQEVDAMLSHLNTLTDTAFDPGRIMQISVSNVICSIALGQHFKHDDQQFLHMVEIMDRYIEAYLDTADARFIPVLRLLPHKKAAMKRRGCASRSDAGLLERSYHKSQERSRQRGQFRFYPRLLG